MEEITTLKGPLMFKPKQGVEWKRLIHGQLSYYLPTVLGGSKSDNPLLFNHFHSTPQLPDLSRIKSGMTARRFACCRAAGAAAGLEHTKKSRARRVLPFVSQCARFTAAEQPGPGRRARPGGTRECGRRGCRGPCGRRRSGRRRWPHRNRGRNWRRKGRSDPAPWRGS